MNEHHCCCHEKKDSQETKSCCSSLVDGDKAFLDSLNEEMRALILDGSTAPELPNSGEEIFAAEKTGKLPAWTEACWKMHKSVIQSTIDGGWDNQVHPWNREMQDFWKYPLAFTAYGIPSLVITDPGKYEEACDILRKTILLMKDAGACDEWTRYEFGKDPVTTKNVMYKGHLNLMYGLYQLLSGSKEFEDEYKNLNNIITTESLRNSQEHGYWGIECEPDQYFTPCNSIAMTSMKVYDLIFGTNFTAEIAEPTAKFLANKMRDPETGMFLFRYHPSCDYAEPYLIGDAWCTSMLQYFLPNEGKHAFEGIKREFLADIKGGKECYLKANRFSAGASTDYEQSTWVLYVPFMSREYHDKELWEKITRFFMDMYGICLENGELVFKEAEPGMVTHMEGYLFLGAVHLGWDKVLGFDWNTFRKEHGRN